MSNGSNKGSKDSNLRLAARTLYEEALEFKFSYPLTIVPGAGPKNSLHYYIFKYAPNPPKRTATRFDPKGIVQVWSRITGQVYRPAFIAAYALQHLEKYLLFHDSRYLETFLSHVNWLEKHAITRKDGAVVWPHDFNYREGPVDLRPPWVSANAQGLVISALVRAWRLTGNRDLLPLMQHSSRIFELDHLEDGVRVRAEGRTLFAEIPGLPAPGIMDGFMRALLGLYDLYEETRETKVGKLFDEGVAGLRHFLPEWDYRHKWSIYSNRQYLCPPSYHCLNRMLLSALANITSDRTLSEYARAWDPSSLSLTDRAEIYLAFLWTKNACRFKYKSWRQQPARSDKVAVPRSRPEPRRTLDLSAKNSINASTVSRIHG